ncbi:MAG: hypothetical protein ACFE89_08245 [Candidatus Hodarchaeota archaeon]
MKKQKQKISIEGLSIEGKPCNVTITFDEGLPNTFIEAITTALTGSPAKHQPPSPQEESPNLTDIESWSKYQKVRYIVLRHCRHGWFNSKDLQELYDRTFHPPISLTTASEYLRRLHTQEVLSRRGSAAQREYRVNIENLEEEIATILATKA